MPLFIREDSKKLKSKQVIIPDNVANKIRQNMNMYSDEKDSNGYKRLKSLTDKEYNKRSDSKDRQHNDKMSVSFADARRIVHDMSHMEQSPKNKEFNMLGGYDTLYSLKNGLRQARSSVKEVKPVPEVPKLEKNPTKVPDVKDDVKVGSLNVHINESMGDFLDDYYYYYYATSEILDYFLEHGEEPQNWGVLINPSEYQKALSEFVHYGKLINFPSDRVYQWMGIIMRNTAKIYANTILRGHEQEIPDLDTCETFFERYLGDKFIEVDYKVEGPKYYVDENFLRNRCEQIKRHCKAITLATNEKELVDAFNSYDYESSKFEIQSDGRLAFSHNYMDFFDEIGLYGTMVLPDGSDAISDYGLKPLFEIIDDYDESLPPEKVLVLINRILDVYHMRGDLASAFIVGGSNSLSSISEEVNKLKGGKTIYITEKQLLLLKEYHNELNIPFDDPSRPYDLKDNYEHLVDFFEEIGKYGKLPSTGFDKFDYNQYIYNIIEGVDGTKLKAWFDGIESGELMGVQMFVNFINNYYDCEELFKDDDRLTNILNICKEKGHITEDDVMDAGIISDDEYRYADAHIDPFDLLSYEGPLTDYGREVYTKNILKERLEDFIDEQFNFEIDERGLIRIEREITIPAIHSKYMSAVDREKVTHDENNYYQHLIDNYGGVGNCWTFREGWAEAYCGQSFGSGTFSATMVGYVNPNDVIWDDTLELNLAIPYEAELRLKVGATVEIDKVTVVDELTPDKKTFNLPLRGPILISA